MNVLPNSFDRVHSSSEAKTNIKTVSSPVGHMEIKHKTSEVKNLTNFADILKKLEAGQYVPPHTLARFNKELKASGYEVEQLLAKNALLKAMQSGQTCFAQAKPASKEHLKGIRQEKQPFPKTSLTRMLTGDVKPEWLVGLGRMQSNKITPAEGYKDVFVSSLEEYEKKGIHFDFDSKNDPVVMAEKLDLKKTDLKLIQNQGAWLLLIHPGSKLAIPTERKSEWNPEYVEGGYTGSDQQEWVTPNLGLDYAVRTGEIKIFKMDTEGNTVEWKFFQGKLMPVDEREKAIKEYVASVAKKSMIS